jgi:hypothetical protein
LFKPTDKTDLGKHRAIPEQTTQRQKIFRKPQSNGELPSCWELYQASKRYASNSFYASSTDSARVFLNLSNKVARATFGSGHSNQISYIEILYTKK